MGTIKAALFLRTLFLVWLLVFVLSIVLALVAEETGSGFTRGLNRAEIFFSWQFYAVGLAVISAVTARLSRLKVDKALRGLGYLPIAVHFIVGILLLLVAAFLAFID